MRSLFLLLALASTSLFAAPAVHDGMMQFHSDTAFDLTPIADFKQLSESDCNTHDHALDVMLAEPKKGTSNDDLATPADVIHPNIHANNNAGNNASPNDSNAGSGNMHGIANNPGRSGSRPNDDGVNGFANELGNVHGGIGSKNKNVD